MAKINLTDTYEQLLPKRQYRVNASKKIETTSESDCLLKKLEGGST